MPRAFNHPPAGDISLDTVLYALSDPMRRHIISKLMARESMSCIQACATAPPSTVSFHHKILREAGLIHSEKKGVEVINSLRRRDIEQRFPGLLDAIFRIQASPLS